MKEMEKLFSRIFPKGESKFYSVDEPLEIPEISKPLPGNYIEAIDDHIFDIEKELALLKENCKSYFKGGESEALIRLEKKVKSEEKYIRNFRKPRTISTNTPDNPSEPETTGLSPYLSFGCLSPRLLWKETEKCYRNGEHTQPPESMHGQLLFREMFYILSKSVENWDSDTNNSMCKKIKWGDYDPNKMELWENGQTGFPYIDAMMRQLDATGWMHHLGRHAVSCFLTRGQLWQHWEIGRAMEIVYKKNQLEKFVGEAFKAAEKNPILIDKFINHAMEIDVDAISDGKQVHVAGIMQHIEEAGIHSGDSACCLPPVSIKPFLIKEIENQTKKLALALKVKGFMNIQFAIKKDKIFVIEVNPRASRTVPFVSKAKGLPFARIASRVMAGEKLSNFDLKDKSKGMYAVK